MRNKANLPLFYCSLHFPLDYPAQAMHARIHLNFNWKKIVHKNGEWPCG